MSKAIANAKSNKAAVKGDAAKTKSNKTAIKGDAAKTPAAETIKAAAAPKKADKAREIFAECYGMKEVPARKDIIARAVAEAGLTQKGAATYLQNYRTKQGMVAAKQ